MSHRTWIKIYVDKWLEGTISEESASLRGIWVSLLALAGNGKYGDVGKIMALNDVGFNDHQLYSMLKINRQQWVASKKRLQITDRIKVHPNNIIEIVNWHKYQSEYDRVSKYRTKSTTSDTTNDTAIEDRGERIDNRKKINKEFFTKLWEAYPLHKDKLKAEKTFDKLKPSEELVETMVKAIARQKAEREHSNGFTPEWKYLATWLNGACWNDEPLKLKTQGKVYKDL